jgi:hypothetical protein
VPAATTYAAVNLVNLRSGCPSGGIRSGQNHPPASNPRNIHRGGVKAVAWQTQNCAAGNKQTGLTSNSLKVCCSERLNALKAPSLVSSAPHTYRMRCGGDVGTNKSGQWPAQQADTAKQKRQGATGWLRL